MKSCLQELTDYLQRKRLMVTTAESCTAGLVAKLLTDQAGSSQWMDRGFVTYSNEAKKDMLGVLESTLTEFGAVSRETVDEMASGAINNSKADVALSISGIAGPDGGSEDKPVGTVWFGWAARTGETRQAVQQFPGDRESVRVQAAEYALCGLLEFLGER